MFVELRRYRIVPGELHHYIHLYQSVGVAIQSLHLGKPLGYYTPMTGNQNEVIHLWQYLDLEDRTKRRAELFADQKWLSFISQTKPLILDMHSDFINPVILEESN
ncbi:MAG TPA: NIPSNAP family protein [Gammaproteobacteria bacterium]|nr:NIPSNAP family protein [Gammaproteobacteria bacterium]